MSHPEISAPSVVITEKPSDDTHGNEFKIAIIKEHKKEMKNGGRKITKALTVELNKENSRYENKT